MTHLCAFEFLEQIKRWERMEDRYCVSWPSSHKTWGDEGYEYGILRRSKLQRRYKDPKLSPISASTETEVDLSPITTLDFVHKKAKKLVLSLEVISSGISRIHEQLPQKQILGRTSRLVDQIKSNSHVFSSNQSISVALLGIGQSLWRSRRRRYNTTRREYFCHTWQILFTNL